MRLKTLSRTRVLLRSRECEVGGAAARAASHASVYHGPSTCHQSSTAPAQERAMESLGVPQRPLTGRPDGSRACYVYGIGWSIKKIVSARCLCRSCGVDGVWTGVLSSIVARGAAVRGPRPAWPSTCSGCTLPRRLLASGRPWREPPVAACESSGNPPSGPGTIARSEMCMCKDSIDALPTSRCQWMNGRRSLRPTEETSVRKAEALP